MPVPHLAVTGRLPRSCLCQSVICGESALPRAAACFSRTWEQLIPTQSLRGLCWELQASGDVLLARLAGGGSHPNVTGSFASPSCPPLPRMAVAALSMGCALVPAELVLPPGGAPPYTLTSPSHHSCCLTSGAG